MRPIHNASTQRRSFLHGVRNGPARAVAVCSFAFVLVSAGGGMGRAEAPAGQPVDGIRCDATEGAVLHIHQHLAIYDRGAPVAIPGDIGRPLFAPCLYWLHTHSSDGLIHVESPVRKTFTLGNFFDVWGEPLSAQRVAAARVKPDQLRVYVNGRLFRGNPRAVKLAPHADITLEAGAPFRTPAPFVDWQGQ